MTLLLNKPKPITLLNRTDPLMRGLVCAAALNEPGSVARNLLRHGLFAGTPAAGGLATDITAGHEPWYNGLDSGYTFCLWHDGITLGTWESIISINDSTLSWQRYSTSTYFKNYHNGTGQTMSNLLLSEIASPGMLVCLWNGSQMRAYVDGVQVGSVAMAALPKTNSTVSTLKIGGSCIAYQFLAYDRALSESEIQRLCQQPLALFREAGLWPPAMIGGGTLHDLNGSTGATAQLSAAVRATRRLFGSVDPVASVTSTLRESRSVSGTCTAHANLTASLAKVGTVTLAATVSAGSSSSAALTVTSSAPEMLLPSEMDWLGDALFYGATARAFKLGTALTGGWFWTHGAGCTTVCRGPSIGQVDFDDILDVANRDAKEIVLPAHLTHEPNGSYCYVVRRFNACGHPERTTVAAAVARLDADGRLAGPVPNGVSGLKLDPLVGQKIRLVWFYCPLDQQAEPEVFRIYTDNGTGQLDWESPMVTVVYEGRKFYRYETEALPDGSHQFVVVAEREDQVGHRSLSFANCPIQSHYGEGVTILVAEAIS